MFGVGLCDFAPGSGAPCHLALAPSPFHAALRSVKLVLQRVSSASVSIDGTMRGAIERGLLILLGVAAGDAEDDARWLAEKAAALRIFPDDAGLMNRSVRDIGGGILVISQFTLIASTRKGIRGGEFTHRRGGEVQQQIKITSSDHALALLAEHFDLRLPAGTQLAPL